MVILLMSWVGLAALPPTSRPASQPADLLARGRAYLAANRPIEAVACLTRAAAGQPNDVEIQVALARAYEATGDLDAAEGVLSGAIRRSPGHAGLWLAWIDAALAGERYGAGLERIDAARRELGGKCAGRLSFRAAEALFGLEQYLGDPRVRHVPGGRAGQFVGDWLLVERRAGVDRFLCCGADAALYQVRQALDGGLGLPAAYLLHARIWQRLERPEVALGLLRGRAAAILPGADAETLEVFAEVSLAAGAIEDYLRYERRRANQLPAERTAILFAACLTAAEHYGEAGDELMHVHWLHRAVRLCPENTGVRLRLADAEWEAGRQAWAVQHYREVLRQSPEHAERGRIVRRLAEAAHKDQP